MYKKTGDNSEGRPGAVTSHGSLFGKRAGRESGCGYIFREKTWLADV